MVRTVATVMVAALGAVALLAQMQAPAFRPPDPLPEVVSPTENFSYIPSLSGARLLETQTIAGPLEVRQGTADDEAVLAGNTYARKSYGPSRTPPAVFVSHYRDALFASGWTLIDSTKVDEKAPPSGSVGVAAHYRAQGRNIYARVTQETDGSSSISVADVGAEDWDAAFTGECRLRIPSIHFELDAAGIKLPESEPTLRKLAELVAAATARVEIQGHMDSVGEAGAAARQELSAQRAQSVLAWLTLHGGIPARKLSAKGYGRSRPVAENDTDLGRALNRRIEVAPEGCQPARARRFLGFTPDSTARQAALESRFRAGVDPDSISSLHRPLAERPHPSGTAATKAIVDHLERTLRGFGLDVKVHEYQALLSQPRRVELRMTAPQSRAISITEPPIPEDPTSSHHELGGGYVAYSPSGTASGEIVFVNYGLPADYEELQTRGVTVKGRIALARYGRSHRAVKVHTAQDRGASALILYSDPADDGPTKGPAWPRGYWRGGDMLQRGNAKFSWFWHGDPLTPGVAATTSATRLDPSVAPTLPKIPVAVIAANAAAALKPGGVSVRLDVDMDQRLMPIFNVVATLEGARHPNRRILLGTHHDAWTFGGVDPGTGASVLLEVAKGLGALAKTGWRPSRTIALAFWDAEEFGLVGSTEYAEDLRATLQEQLIAYVNTDMYMTGRFDPGGVPSLSPFVADVTKDVPGWQTTVFEEWQQSARSATPDLEALGSGADFVPFQDHLGVPTLAIEFIGENGYGFGTYHSNYDSRAYVEAIADPGFRQGAMLARVLGTLALRMSEANVLPFRFSHYATRLKEAAESAKLPSLSARIDRIASQSGDLEAAIDERLQSGAVPQDVAALNDRLARLEQRLADDDGAPESRWYRHVFHGWNIYSLYDGQPFPGYAEAVRRQDTDRIRHETGRIERALDRMSAELTAARALIR